MASGARSRHAAAPPPPMRSRQLLAPRYKITKKGMSKSAVRTMSGTKLVVDNTELKAADKAVEKREKDREKAEQKAQDEARKAEAAAAKAAAGTPQRTEKKSGACAIL